LAGSSISDAYTLNAARLTDVDRLGTSADEEGWPVDPRHGIYQTRDAKHVFLACAGEQRWTAFCKAIDRPELVDNVAGMVDQEIVAELRDLIGSRTLDAWVDLAATRGFGCTPVRRNLFEVQRDPQVASRGLLVDGEHPIA